MISLNGKWQFKKCGTIQYFDGVVPGSVYADLLSNKLMPNQYYRENEDEVKALYNFNYEYIKSFQIDSKFLENERIILAFDGVDTIADIFVNGQKIAHTENFHVEYRYEVKSYLKEGENEIKVVLYSPSQYIKNAQDMRPLWGVTWQTMPGYNHIRKPHYMFGWDWGPMLPDLGIWNNVSLIEQNTAVIEDFLVRQKHFTGSVELEVLVECDVFENQKVELLCEVTSPNGEKIKSQIIAFNGKNLLDLTIQCPLLWWPNGLGEQNLYGICVSLLKGGKAISTMEKELGLRTLTINRSPDKWGESFCFEVNGKAIFATGANYIPEDNILGLCTKERTKTTLQNCVDANFNCVRVWGGGLYATDYFMELCDKMGLVVWHDFMFACAIYDLDEAFKNNITKEVICNIKRLRNHASLGMFCGNNEMEIAWTEWGLPENLKLRQDYFEQFERIIPELVKKYSPDIFYWPASPSSEGGFVEPNADSRGDAHYWDVWHGKKWFSDFENYHFRFASEYGFQSLPSMKTIRTFAENEDLSLYSPVMEKHQKCSDSIGNNGNMIIANYLSNYYAYPTSFEKMVYASQILQGDCLRTAIEHYRRNRGRCMGSTYWQLNDSNPVISWSTIDYYGRWKASHYFVKRCYAPVLLSAVIKESKINLHLINDKNVQFSGKIVYRLISQTKGILIENSIENVACDELNTTIVSEINAENYISNSIENREIYFEYTLYSDNNIISSEVLTIEKAKHFSYKKPNIIANIYREDDATMLEICSDCYAGKVGIEFDDFDIVLEDNYFDLTEYTPRIIKLNTNEDIKKLKSNIQITSIYDIAK